MAVDQGRVGIQALDRVVRAACDTRDVWTESRESLAGGAAAPASAAVDLYWLPLGAGGHSVRLNGRVYEALAARVQRRPACDLYHSALQIQVREGTYVVEQTPVPDLSGSQRGVVAGGAVGSRWAGESPRRLASDDDHARRVLELVAQVPTPVWGRDELGTGEMWNSNSVIAWVIARSRIDADSIQPPAGGRAPGWHAGLAVARRHDAETARNAAPSHKH
jgi:hypothetical protein